MISYVLLLISITYTQLSWAAFIPADRKIDVEHYRIKLSLDPSQDPNEFNAHLELVLKAKESLEKISLDTDNLVIHKVSEGQKVLEHKLENSILEISLGRTLKKGSRFVFQVQYSGKINSSHDGFFKVTDPDEPKRGPLFFTHFEPLKARSFFPSNDEPYDKATTEVIMSVPIPYEVLSNGRKVSDRKFSEQGKPWREIRWLQEKPHSTYLVSLAVGLFTKVVDSPQRPEVSAWVGETKTEKAKFVVEATRKMLRFFESYLEVKYPWPKYASIGLPTFLWGGMENTSSTHMNQERIVLNDPRSEFEKKGIVSLAAHELAHQWFGDYATMKWWDDIWLNEAFASYLGTLATQDFFKSEEANIELVTDTWDYYFREEDGPRSHPIVNRQLSSPDDAFDATAYTKGENLLRMLSYYVGEDKFKKGLNLYLKRFALSNASYVDLFNSMEKTSGLALSQFRDSWLLQRGYPVITYSGQWDPNTSTYHLNLASQPNHGTDKSTFVFRMPVVFHRRSNPSYSKELSLIIDQPTHVANTPLLAEPEWVSVNPGGIVLGRVKQLERNEEKLAVQGLNDPDGVLRVWANHELANGLKEGGEVSSLAEKTLLRTLETDPSPYVRISLLSVIQKMKSRWLPPALGLGLFSLSKKVLAPDFGDSALYQSDPHGWSEFRSELISGLGRVENKEVFPFLADLLKSAVLPLDDVRMTAYSIALQGDPAGIAVLKEAVRIHEGRGYRFKYWILYAFGAFENTQAASVIRQLADTSGSDLIGRIGWIISDNQTLKGSPEWASFLKEFILTNQKHGEEVKSRLLHTIEEVKTAQVSSMLRALVKESGSQRLRESSKKILEKNFGEKVVSSGAH